MLKQFLLVEKIFFVNIELCQSNIKMQLTLFRLLTIVQYRDNCSISRFGFQQFTAVQKYSLQKLWKYFICIFDEKEIIFMAI